MTDSPATAQSHDLHQLLALTLADGLGPVLTARMLSTFGSPDAVMGASASALARVHGIGEKKAAGIKRSFETSHTRVEHELALANKHNVTLIPIGDPAYPALLATIHDPPTILYVRGSITPEDSVSVAIVGARACTHYGIEQAARFATMLSRSGLTIVSGGARGIDTSAHRASLTSSGRTIAVLGCGLSHCYPPENKQLFDEIASGHGAIISALPMNTAPEPKNFPPRNRIISALSLGTLVVEAGKRSGALITARLAAEEHHREVFALPGRVDSSVSEGTNNLIVSGGAAAVTEPAHILEKLQGSAHTLIRGAHDATLVQHEDTRGKTVAAPSDPIHKTIFEALEEPLSADQLVERTNITAHEVGAALTMMELTGHIARNGARFERK
ncbi:MAG: DNA-protecting protein DprA [Phycisphaeraceae bacterium]|nr:DNA-processing protein DprA [Phycisphaerales bacterium]MCB9859658.1 DNA-protecting protein DprA [Phycisphaeraceae bacterium]